MTFSKLTENSSREEKILTFIPLLHLAQQNKIELLQESPFGEIQIMLKKKEEAKPIINQYKAALNAKTEPALRPKPPVDELYMDAFRPITRSNS